MERGTEEVRDLAKFLVELAEGMANAARDGKWDVRDAVYFWDAVRAIPAAVTGAAEIPAELADMDGWEAKELVDYISAELELPVEYERAERITEKALALIPPLVDLIREFAPIK